MDTFHRDLSRDLLLEAVQGGGLGTSNTLG